jgi:acyl carrier protein
MSDTLKRLQEIIGEQLAIEPKKIKSNADFVKELGADSLDVIELVMDIEDQYASKIATVQDALDYIEKN